MQQKHNKPKLEITTYAYAGDTNHWRPSVIAFTPQILSHQLMLNILNVVTPHETDLGESRRSHSLRHATLSNSLTRSKICIIIVGIFMRRIFFVRVLG